MVKRTGSSIRGSRYKRKTQLRQKGKPQITRYFAKYKPEEKVVLKASPAVQGGIYHMRFHGRAGIVKGIQGRCYLVNVKDGSKQKTLIVHPAHLKRMHEAGR
jgi:large subunit ribosomal protein L21e